MNDQQPSRAGTLRRPPRLSQVPPAPGWPRPEWMVLGECGPVLGVALWQFLRDVGLWAQVPSGQRAGLFRPVSAARARLLDTAAAEAPELVGALGELSALVAAPERAEAARVAEACERVLVWAELRGMRETALQFAEAAARVESDQPLRNHAAGRLCRRVHDFQRSSMWYRRGYRLARLKGLEAECAIAAIGLGGVALDQGRLDEAEKLLWKAARAALRQGRHRLAGSAHHDLLGVMIAGGRYEEAMQHAERAITLYPQKHHRIPNLAFDIGFLWMRLSYFSSSIYLFERILPWFETQSHQILVVSALARSTAAVHDRIRFERASARVMRLVADGNDRAASSVYHLAEGARYFELWDRSGTLARQALGMARLVGNRSVMAAAEGMLAELPLRRQGPLDIVPEEGSVVDRVTGMLLKKLAKQPAPGLSEAMLFPERHQLD